MWWGACSRQDSWVTLGRSYTIYLVIIILFILRLRTLLLPPQMRVSRHAVLLQRLTNKVRQQLKLLLKSLRSQSLLLQPMAHEETNYCPRNVIYRHDVDRCPGTREATSTAQSRSFARMILFAVLLITHPSDDCFFPLFFYHTCVD